MTNALDGWGLFDMHGNVSEWCRDGWKNELVGGEDPVQPEGVFRPYRGGHWGAEAWVCRSAFRVPQPIDNNPSGAGFRIVLVPAEK